MKRRPPQARTWTQAVAYLATQDDGATIPLLNEDGVELAVYYRADEGLYLPVYEPDLTLADDTCLPIGTAVVPQAGVSASWDGGLLFDGPCLLPFMGVTAEDQCFGAEFSVAGPSASGQQVTVATTADIGGSDNLWGTAVRDVSGTLYMLRASGQTGGSKDFSAPSSLYTVPSLSGRLGMSRARVSGSKESAYYVSASGRPSSAISFGGNQLINGQDDTDHTMWINCNSGGEASFEARLTTVWRTPL